MPRKGNRVAKQKVKANRAKTLIDVLAMDPRACQLFASSWTVAGRLAFQQHLKSLIAELWPSVGCIAEHLFSDICAQCSAGLDIPSAVDAAYNVRSSAVGRYKNSRKKFVRKLGFTEKGREQHTHRLDNMERLQVFALEEAYPPLGEWVYESVEIEQKWRRYIETGRQPDRRLPRLPLHHLDPSRLQLDIAPERSAIILDATTGEIQAIIVRDFCQEEKVLHSIHNVIEEAMFYRKNIRLEDPGSLVQIGFSAGARSCPHFDWVRNIKTKLPKDTTDKINGESSSVFALMWNLCRGSLLPEVLDDFDKFLKTSNIARMDPAEGAAKASTSSLAPSKGKYNLKIGDYPFEFHDAELAPPCGFFARNYSRAIHLETQPHKYAISWTIKRTHPYEGGGHFFLAKYGVRIAAAANTLVVWKPIQPHGTSLQNLHPCEENPGFIQTGIAIVTPSRLPKVWKQYCEGEITHKEASKGGVGDGDDFGMAGKVARTRPE